MTVPIDKADFVDLLERAAWSFADEDWEWFLTGLSPPVQRRRARPRRSGEGSAPGRFRTFFPFENIGL